jgi:hypothetical protein
VGEPLALTTFIHVSYLQAETDALLQLYDVDHGLFPEAVMDSLREVLPSIPADADPSISHLDWQIPPEEVRDVIVPFASRRQFADLISVGLLFDFASSSLRNAGTCAITASSRSTRPRRRTWTMRCTSND